MRKIVAYPQSVILRVCGESIHPFTQVLKWVLQASRRMTGVVLICTLLLPAAPARAGEVFNRMVKSGTIQCGYLIYEPVVMKAPNTDEMSGIAVDIMDEIAARTGLGLKVEWTVESSYGTFGEDIKRPNVDLLCSTIWTMISTGVYGTSTVPLWYSGLGAFVRADETRFSDIGDLNDPAVTISSMDGSISEIVAAQDFPNAKILAMPHMSDYALQLVNVVDGKADAAFIEVNMAQQFLKKHPGALKNLIPERPLRVYSNAFMVRKGEQEMLNFMNMALTELVNDGFVDRLLTRYEAAPGSLYRVRKPYEVIE